MININKILIKDIFPKRPPDSNKGDYGKVLCITGSKQYIGAGILSALGALKVGAGYSILCSEIDAIEHYKNFSLDLIYKSHEHFNFEKVQEILETNNINALVFGCGIGKNDYTLAFTEKLLKYLYGKNIKTVIDADGLNCLAELNISLNENFILTPHPKELSRLIKFDTDEIVFNKEKYLNFACEKYKSVIVLKTHNSLIGTNKTIYQNHSGNSALAKAGTGDVLAGIIGGFLAQNVNTTVASILSVYIHGLASDIYSEQYSQYSMLASDLLNFIPLAINKSLS